MRSTRLLALMLAGLLAAGALPGCGKTADAPAEESQSAVEEESSQEVSLSTDDDTFHLNMLARMIQTPDSGVTELLGDGDKQTYDADGDLATRVYSGVLFHHDVQFTVSYHLNDVSQIDVVFAQSDADMDAFAEAVTGELEKEPSGDNTWKTDTCVVTLEEADGQAVLTLAPYSG